jgi:hypothetical protein
MNSVKRYLPKKVYDEIERSDYKNKQHLWVITDMIYRMSIYRKEDKKSSDYVDIPRNYFRDIIIKYKIHIDYLLEKKIIECDNTYSLEQHKALGYRFTEQMVSKIIPVEITKKVLSENIIKNRNERYNLVDKNLQSYRNHFVNTFKLDTEKAVQHLEDWYTEEHSKVENGTTEYINLIQKYNILYLSLRTIDEGDLFFRRNETNGRIDTNLTSLKSEYKQFIKTPNLWQIDIVNSQPFFLSLYLNSLKDKNLIDKVELQKYILWTSTGSFYEMFTEEYFKSSGKKLNRKDVKEIMFCIFYSKNGNFVTQKSIFRSLFPTIMDFIENEKKVSHREFSIKLQRIESSFCIDVICKELDKRDIKYYTIHDAWLINEKHINDVNNIIVEKFNNKFGITPQLKIENIN